MTGTLTLFAICADRSRFIFEVCGDLFGKTLTVEELEYWIAYSIIQNAIRNDVDYKVLSLRET